MKSPLPSNPADLNDSTGCSATDERSDDDDEGDSASDHWDEFDPEGADRWCPDLFELPEEVEPDPDDFFLQPEDES